jgi:hypothetical protein
VKRGLFILDNAGHAASPLRRPCRRWKIGRRITDHEPTIRELQELHRREPLCRLPRPTDPLGLPLENFNALECIATRIGAAIDASGELLTGKI